MSRGSGGRMVPPSPPSTGTRPCARPDATAAPLPVFPPAPTTPAPGPVPRPPHCGCVGGGHARGGSIDRLEPAARGTGSGRNRRLNRRVEEEPAQSPRTRAADSTRGIEGRVIYATRLPPPPPPLLPGRVPDRRATELRLQSRSAVEHQQRDTRARCSATETARPLNRRGEPGSLEAGDDWWARSTPRWKVLDQPER